MYYCKHDGLPSKSYVLGFIARSAEVPYALFGKRECVRREVRAAARHKERAILFITGIIIGDLKG